MTLQELKKVLDLLGKREECLAKGCVQWTGIQRIFVRIAHTFSDPLLPLARDLYKLLPAELV